MTRSIERKIEYILLAFIFASMIQGVFAGFNIHQYRMIFVVVGAVMLLLSCIIIDRFHILIFVYFVTIILFLGLGKEEIVNGLQIISNKMTDAINKTMDLGFYYYVSVDLDRSRIDSVIAITFLIVCIGLIVALLRRKSILLFVLTGIGEMALLIIAPYSISYTFFLFLGAWIAYDGVKRHKWRYGCFIGCILTLIAVPIYYYDSMQMPEETQVKEEFLVGVRQMMQGNEYQASGGISNGEIGKIGAINPKGTDLFQISGESQQNLYLKSYVSGLYQDGSWKMEDTDQLSFEGESAHELPYLYTDLKLNQLMDLNKAFGEQQSLKIKYENMDDYYYQIPYFANILELEGDKKADTYITRGIDINEYELLFYPIKNINDILQNSKTIHGQIENISIEETYLKAMDEYKQFVEDNYTDVPEKLNRNFKKNYATLYKEGSTYEKIKRVQNFLKRNYTYTYRPGLTPDGEDPIEFFLDERKKGFCTQYASAAVMILRSQGIPARYVEGYRLKNTDWTKDVAHVTDYNAHAWPEVFVDDVGWIPIEVTGISGGEATYKKIKQAEAKTPKITVQPRTVISNIGKVVGCMVLVIILIIIARLAIVYQWKKKFLTYSNREKVLHYDKLFMEEGVHFFENNGKNKYKDVQNVIQKARYSQNEINEKDLQTVEKWWIEKNSKKTIITKMLHKLKKC